MVNGCIYVALLSKALYSSLLIHPFTHTHTLTAASYHGRCWHDHREQFWGSVSCPRTLRHVDRSYLTLRRELDHLSLALSGSFRLFGTNINTFALWRGQTTHCTNHLFSVLTWPLLFANMLTISALQGDHLSMLCLQLVASKLQNNQLILLKALCYLNVNKMLCVYTKY